MLVLEHVLGLPLGLSSIDSRQKEEQGKGACLEHLRDRKKAIVAEGSIMNKRERDSK